MSEGHRGETWNPEHDMSCASKEYILLARRFQHLFAAPGTESHDGRGSSCKFSWALLAVGTMLRLKVSKSQNPELELNPPIKFEERGEAIMALRKDDSHTLARTSP